MKTAKLVLGIVSIVTGAILLLFSFNSGALAIASLFLIAAGIVGLCTRKNAPGGFTAAGLFFGSAIFCLVHSLSWFIGTYIFLAFGGVFLVTSLEMSKRCSYTTISILWFIFFFPIGLYYMWSKTKWNLIAKIFITILLGVAILFGLTSALLHIPTADLPQDTTSDTTTPVDITNTETTSTTAPTEIPTSTVVETIPEYILYTLTEELLFFDVDLVSKPDGNDGIWTFSAVASNFDLTVTTNNNLIESVVLDNETTLYENGSIIMTLYDYEESIYKARCQQISYKELARNPELYKNQEFVFTGEVIQVIEDEYKLTLRINVTPSSVGSKVYYSDTIYATYRTEPDADRILDGDIITFWGTCSGLITYESIFGQQISLPGMYISYYELSN